MIRLYDPHAERRAELLTALRSDLNHVRHGSEYGSGKAKKTKQPRGRAWSHAVHSRAGPLGFSRRGFTASADLIGPNSLMPDQALASTDSIVCTS